MLGLRGQRDLDQGVQPVADPREAAALRARSKGIITRVLMIGAVASVLLVSL